MDKARDPAFKRNRKIRRILYIVLAIGAISGVSVVLARMRPAAPTIDAGTVWPDTVKQGEFTRSVRGLGTLVPEDVQWIPALVVGRVKSRLIQAGTVVKPETVIFELTSPEIQQQLLDAEAQMKSAEAAYVNRKADLESQLLTLKSQAKSIESQYQQTLMELEANKSLHKEGIVSDLTIKKLESSVSELTTRNQLEKQRIEMAIQAMKTQMDVSQAALDQTKTLYELRKKQADNLFVKAGMNGVLQELAVTIGESVGLGTRLARVSDPTHLKADIQIAETQAKDIREGQVAQIDTRNGIIPGRVRRIDPSVQNGTRLVEVQLLGELPAAAVPYANVDGVIELERLENVLYIQRPAFGQEGSTVKLFKYDETGKYADAVTVQLGRSSVTTIEIKSGLKVGDKVIVSDTSQLGDNAERIRLN